MALLSYAPLGATSLALGFDTLALMGGGGAVALAMLPDYDQRVPGIQHRGPTHTVWFALGVGLFLGTGGVTAGWSHGPLSAIGLGAFAAAVGTTTVTSHIAADALTPAGVRPFAPRSDTHYTYDLARASNPVANYVLLGIGVAAVAGALAVGSTLAGF